MKEKIINTIFSPKIYGPILIILLAIIIYKMIVTILNKATIKGKTELEKNVE
ncbi:MAG: hypothetical protein PHF21_01055 [Bacilli bacterium]|nr:hypothetical protein [Bacilli bacterium]